MRVTSSPRLQTAKSYAPDAAPERDSVEVLDCHGNVIRIAGALGLDLMLWVRMSLAVLTLRAVAPRNDLALEVHAELADRAAHASPALPQPHANPSTDHKADASSSVSSGRRAIIWSLRMRSSTAGHRSAPKVSGVVRDRLPSEADLMKPGNGMERAVFRGPALDS